MNSGPRFTFNFDHIKIGTTMRTSTLLALLGAAALSAPAFGAPAAAAPAAASSAMVAVQTIQDQHHALRPADAGDLVGSYDLSDGRTLRVSYAQRKLFAEVGSSKTELVPAGPRTFVSDNEDMKLVFDQLPFANHVTLTRK
jgi:hypothetical protein